MPLVELLGFSVAHLFLCSIVIEGSSSLLVAGQHAIVVLFLIAGAGVVLRRCSRTVVQSCTPATASLGFRQVMAQFFFFRGGDLVIVGRAKVRRRICVGRKGSWSPNQSLLVSYRGIGMYYLSTWCCGEVVVAVAGANTNFRDEPHQERASETAGLSPGPVPFCKLWIR